MPLLSISIASLCIALLSKQGPKRGPYLPSFFYVNVVVAVKVADVVVAVFVVVGVVVVAVVVVLVL